MLAMLMLVAALNVQPAAVESMTQPPAQVRPATISPLNGREPVRVAPNCPRCDRKTEPVLVAPTCHGCYRKTGTEQLAG